MSNPVTLPSLLRPAAAAMALSLAGFLAACISADGEMSASDQQVAPGAVAASEEAFAFRAAESLQGWFPIREGVTVERDAATGAGLVRYRRERGTASGIAIHLAPNACTELASLVLRGASTPGQRLHLCLTDANGVVWTFPTVKLGSEMQAHRVGAAEIAPDPFQNAGKSIPAKPDWSSMRMLTVLDISGHMGAPIEDVTWRIESIVGEEEGR